MSVLGKIVYGLQVAAIGLVVVFLGLTILIVAVKIMGRIMESAAAKKEAAAKAEAAERAAAAARSLEAAAPAPVVEAPAAEEVTDDSELIAVIAAAIAAFDNSGKSLVVRRVRRVSGWNRASRAEQVYRF